MPRDPMTDVINAKVALNAQKRSLKKDLDKEKAKLQKEKTVLLKLMKLGDEEMIDGQAKLVVSIEANVKSITRSQQQLHEFDSKAMRAVASQSSAKNMLSVSKALGRLSNSIQLEKVEGAMTDLGKLYEDIDVMTDVLNTATSKSTAREVDQEAVDRLKRQVADEAGFELRQELNSNEVAKTAPVKVGPTEEEEARSKDSLRAMRAAHEM